MDELDMTLTCIVSKLCTSSEKDGGLQPMGDSREQTHKLDLNIWLSSWRPSLKSYSIQCLDTLKRQLPIKDQFQNNQNKETSNLKRLFKGAVAL